MYLSTIFTASGIRVLLFLHLLLHLTYVLLIAGLSYSLPIFCGYLNTVDWESFQPFCDVWFVHYFICSGADMYGILEEKKSADDTKGKDDATGKLFLNGELNSKGGKLKAKMLRRK